MDRVIAHADIDCFFVQAELLDKTELIGSPVVVYQHDDVLSVSYEAAALGIKRHDSTSQIRLLYPNVTLLSVPLESGTTKVSYNKYIELGDKMIMCIKKCIKNGNIERKGMDEAYFDLTNELSINEISSQMIYGVEEDQEILFTSLEKSMIKMGSICTKIRQLVKQETGLIISIGISNNKMISKIASSTFKPNKQVIVLPRFNSIIVKEYPLIKLIRTHEKKDTILEVIENLDIKLVQDISKNITELKKQCNTESNSGIMEYLMDIKDGIDNRPVKETGIPKSVSSSMTLTPISSSNHSELIRILEFVASSLKTRLERDKKKVYSRYPSSIAFHFRVEGQKELNTNIKLKDDNIDWDNLVRACFDTLILKAKSQCDSSKWKLRWCGMFCKKFTIVEGNTNKISKFFSQDKLLESQLSNDLYPSKSPKPIKTITKKSNSGKKDKNQTSLLSFFNKS